MKSLSLFALILTILLPHFVSAADYSTLPLIVEHTIEQRDIIEETIKVTNSSSRPLRLFPTVNEITVGEDGEIKNFVPASMSNNATSVTSWISVTRGRIEIAPGETIKVPVTITVSPFAVANEYYVFIGFPEGSKRDEAEDKVMAGTAPGTIMRLSLVEKRTEYLRLNRFSIDRLVTSGSDSQITYELENIGGMDIAPAGEIIFYDERGVEETAIPVNPEGRTIAAGKTETFTWSLPDIGNIGRHKAFLNIEYGSLQRANLYDTAYFTVVPLKLLILVFAVLMFISTVLALLYHRRRAVPLDDDEDVSVYVRTGVTTESKDHDINLKN